MAVSRLEQLIAEFCPDGVEYKEIDEIFELKNGYTPSKRNNDFWENGTVPWFTLNDIRTNGRLLDDSIQHVTEDGVKGGKLIPKGSIIMSTTATIGEHALIKVDALTNQQITSFFA
jgi:type I restriction enzyme S subunit